MKAREKAYKGLVEKLHSEGMRQGSKAWVAVARNLNRPSSKRFEVNLTRIEKYAKSGQKIVVPGTVLGNGELKKKVTVAALRFSGPARERISEAGGESLSIEEMYEKNPKGKGLRIMG